MALPWLIGAAAVAGAAALFKETCKECGDTFYSSDCSKYCDYCCEERRERKLAEKKKTELNTLKKEITNKEQNLENYIQNQKEFFREKFDIEIDFDEDYNISILEYSNEQEKRKNRIKALEKEAQELSEVISILKDKRDAIN